MKLIRNKVHEQRWMEEYTVFGEKPKCKICGKEIKSDEVVYIKFYLTRSCRETLLNIVSPFF